MNSKYDVIIICGGPAGLSAAIYLGRAKYSVLVIEKDKIGGQITITSEVVNYPGVLQTSGEALTDQMKQQAIHFGAEFLIGTVTELDLSQDFKVVKTDRGEFMALGVVLATGASPRKLGFKGEMEFARRGIAYCATCDGEFFTGLQVFVIGGGFAAAEEALFLTQYAKKVTVVVRKDRFSCAESIAQEVMAHEQIEVRFQTQLLEVSGAHNLQKALFQDNATGTTYEYQAETDEGFGVKTSPKSSSAKTAPAAGGATSDEGQGGFIDSGMREQLLPIFDRFEKTVILKGYVNDTAISTEVERFLQELEALSPKIQCEIIHKGQATKQDEPVYRHTVQRGRPRTGH